MKRRIIVLVLLVSLLLCGCNNKEASEHLKCSSNEKLIYDRYNTKLISYDIKNKKCTSENNSSNFNLFQYEYDLNSNMYISGHSITNDFELIELVNDTKEIKTHLKIKNTEAMFPVGGMDSKGTRYCVHYYYDEKDITKENESKRCLAVLKDNEIEDISSIEKGLLIDGIIFEDHLYYTVYHEKEDVYALYKINLNDSSFKNELIKDSIDSSGLIATEYGVFYADKGYYHSIDTEKKFSYKEYVYGTFDSKYVFQMYLKGTTTTFEVLDLDTMKTVLAKDEIYDFEISGNKITLYGNGFMEEKEL